MKINRQPIAKKAARRRPVWMLALAVTTAAALAACAQSAETPGTSPDSTPAASITDNTPPAAADPEVALAEQWAAAVKDRDGNAQYALMTRALQEQVHDAFEGLGWVTGTSSPWVENYKVEALGDGGVRVTFELATSTGPAGSYYQDLTFETEDGALKIASVSDPVEDTMPAATAAVFPEFGALVKLLGLTEAELRQTVPGEPEGVDEGGLAYDEAGVRVWFDDETHTKVAQVLIRSEEIDIEGAKVGDSYETFKKVFGEPISDHNGDARFQYGDYYLSVVRDTNTGKVIGVYILAENF
jgi:hypothetical protein